MITTNDSSVRPRSLAELGDEAFVTRHVGPTEAEQAEMARTLGYESAQDLLDAAVPESVRTARSLDLQRYPVALA